MQRNPNLLRYQCESAPDFAVRCAFLRVGRRGQLKGPVNPNGSRMYRGQNSAKQCPSIYNVRQTGKEQFAYPNPDTIFPAPGLRSTSPQPGCRKDGRWSQTTAYPQVTAATLQITTQQTFLLFAVALSVARFMKSERSTVEVRKPSTSIRASVPAEIHKQTTKTLQPQCRITQSCSQFIGKRFQQLAARKDQAWPRSGG